MLESVKKYYDLTDYTFNSLNKKDVKAKFLAELEKSNAQRISMGLYMKNVNKFYLLRLKDNVEDLIDAPDELKN